MELRTTFLYLEETKREIGAKLHGFAPKYYFLQEPFSMNQALIEMS